MPSVEEFSFFSEVDRDPRTGKVVSEYPAWWHTANVEDLEDEVDQMRLALSNGTLKPANVAEAERSLEKLQEKLEDIRKSEPKLDGTMKDDFAKAINFLKAQVRESMPSRESMARNMVDSRAESKLMSEPCIGIMNLPKGAILAAACNVPFKKDKPFLSRDHAIKILLITSKALNEPFFVESLRK